MADRATLASLGRAVYYAEQVSAGNGVFLLVLLQAGQESDATLVDRLTLAAVLAVSANKEAAWTGGTPYARKSYSAVSIDRNAANDRVDLDLTDPTWAAAAAPTSTHALGKVGLCYAPTAGAANSAIIPLAWFDYPVIADGSDLVAPFSAQGVYRSIAG
jgi:hypothetical protein